MPFSRRRSAVSLLVRVRRARRSALTAVVFSASACLAAHGVVVRGRLTDQLGKPVPGGQIRLIRAGQLAAMAYAGPDGTFELRTADSGRFTLLGSAGGFLPFVGEEFYGGTTDVLDQNVVLSGNTIHEQVSVTATGLPTPLPQLTAPVTLFDQGALATRIGVVEELRQSPGAFVVQQGQYGSISSLFVRGGQSAGNKVLIDGVPANDVGGVFDYGTVQSTGIANVELYRGPDSVLYGSDAEASAVSITTPRGGGHPVLNYSGDAGNLHTYRNEVSAGAGFGKFDAFVAASRFDSSNALPNDRVHLLTEAANVGYEVLPQTFLRGTIRNSRGVQGVPGAYDFFGLTQPARQDDNDLFAQGTLENTTSDAWHNLVRYGIARKLETARYFGYVGTQIPVFGYPEYFGNTVTIRGANGYSATGQASMFHADDSLRSNRDELYFQSDKPFTQHLTGLFGFRYENERGDAIIPSYFESYSTQRTNFEYTMELQGDAWHRVFYTVGGAVIKNHLFGLEGVPRIGLAYAPVSPGQGLRGTRLRANFAKGIHEPALQDEHTSLYAELTAAGDTADIAKYNVRPLMATRSRTYDIGVDQNLLGDRLVLKLGYFHNQFDHQFDYIDSNTLRVNFGLGSAAAQVYGAEANTLAYLAQGIETELQARVKQHLFFRGGYTYLDARVERSFSTDAAYGGLSTTNPNLPNVAIGSTYPLVGARPFRRPPHTGFIAANYTHPKFTVSLKGSLASRSDDSTFLSYSDINGDNTLLLPNRNLDFGYVNLDLGATYQWKPRVSFFTQLDNLLNDQHIGPIGYPGLPFTVRAGVKARLGGD